MSNSGMLQLQVYRETANACWSFDCRWRPLLLLISII